MGSTDYLEQYFATNIVFEPLVGELFRSGFLMQVAAAQNDFITPPVISAAEADYERNLANTVDLFHILANDEQHAAAKRALFNRAGWPSTPSSRSNAASRAAADLVAAARQGHGSSRTPWRTPKNRIRRDRRPSSA